MSFIIGKKCVSVCDTACVGSCPVDCIHGPIDTEGCGEEVKTLDSIEGMQLYINPDECIDCGACLQECPVEAIYESEAAAITHGNDEASVIKNYEFFGLKWQ